jgi:hypothetical protein
MKGLKFLDGYVAVLRRSVNMTTVKLIGLKSHFDDAVWMVLAELSYFYR